MTAIVFISRMKNQFDVIIVGAGPAGVSAAISFANNGLDVVLVDTKSKDKIGDKVCGEAISKQTSHQVSELLEIKPPSGDEVNTKVEELILQTALDQDHIVLPAIGYMVDRHKYGQRLLHDALKRGVTLLERTKAVEPIIVEGEVKGVVIKPWNKSESELKSKLVIDCSGVRGVIRTKLEKSFEPLLNSRLTKADIASCYREIIELKSDHDLDGKIVLKYEEDIPEPGYIWFFADGKRKLNCGTGFIKDGDNKDKSVKEIYFNAMNKYYPKDSYKVLDGRGGSVSIRPPLWNAVAPGLIVAGDAAFHADPLTAEGHGPALLAGYFAGLLAKESIEKNAFSTNDLWEYNVYVFREFGSYHARSRILTMALEKLGPKNLEFLLKRKVIKQSDLTSEGILMKRSILSYLAIVLRSLPKIHLLLLMKKAISISKAVAELCQNYPKSPEKFGEWVKKIEANYAKLS